MLEEGDGAYLLELSASRVWAVHRQHFSGCLTEPSVGSAPSTLQLPFDRTLCGQYTVNTSVAV